MYVCVYVYMYKWVFVAHLTAAAAIDVKLLTFNENIQFSGVAHI